MGKTEKIVKYTTTGIFIIVVLGILLYFGFIYLMGTNFVHNEPASTEYYNHVANRISFTTKFRGDKFNSLLDTFLKRNPQYVYSDSSNFFGYDNTCTCDCLPLNKIIYFNDSPKEAYQITYDHDTMYAGGAGIIDIVFLSKNDKWVCTKSSTFDSIEKSRIEHRFDSTILEKIK